MSQPSDRDALWRHYTRYPFVLSRLLVWGLVVLLALWLANTLQGVLVPLLTSLLIAYMLDPAVDALEARGMSRSRGIGVLMIVGTAVALGLVLFLVPTIRVVLGRFAEGGPAMLAKVDEVLLPWLHSWLGDAAPGSLTDLPALIGAELESRLPDLAHQAAAGVATVWERTTSVVASLINVVLIPLFSFYFLRDFDVMKRQVVDLLPPGRRDVFIERATRADRVVGAWFRGQLEVAAILAVLYGIGLGVCFGFTDIGWPAGLALGILAGALNFIPYFGFTVGFTLAVGLLLLDGAGWGPLIGALAVFASVQSLEGYVITPRIVGEAVGLSPVVVIIALLVGGELLGLVGLLLALPAAGVIKVFAPELKALYEGSRWYQQASPEA